MNYNHIQISTYGHKYSKCLCLSESIKFFQIIQKDWLENNKFCLYSLLSYPIYKKQNGFLLGKIEDKLMLKLISVSLTSGCKIPIFKVNR